MLYRDIYVKQSISENNQDNKKELRRKYNERQKNRQSFLNFQYNTYGLQSIGVMYRPVG